jgi:hypothetical protein
MAASELLKSATAAEAPHGIEGGPGFTQPLRAIWLRQRDALLVAAPGVCPAVA